jgi:hypothetical protein
MSNDPTPNFKILVKCDDREATVLLTSSDFLHYNAV